MFSLRHRQATLPSAGLNVAIILIAYFALHVFVRLALPTTLEHDEAQQIFISQFFALGYDGQPPLYNWLQTLVFDLFGVSRAALSILKNSLLLATYLLVWATARRLLERRELAVVATFGLLTLPQLGFESQRDLTHTVAAFFSTALFVYAVVWTVCRPRLVGYLLIGLAAGLCILSKYNVVIFPLAVCLSLLCDPDFRRHVLDRRSLGAMAVATAVVLPHTLWFIRHLDIATKGTIEKMTSESSGVVSIASGLGSFCLAVIACVALTFACFTIAFGSKFLRVLTAGNRWIRVFERAFAMIACVIFLMIVLGKVDSIRDRWLSPYTVVLPLYLCLKMETGWRQELISCRRFVTLSGLLMVLIPIALLLRIMTAGLTREYQYINAPFAPLVADIETSAASPSLFLVLETHVAGNLRLQRPDIPVVALSYPTFQPSFAWTQEHPIVIVWRERKGGTPPPLPAKALNWISDRAGAIGELLLKTRGLPYFYGAPGDTFQFSYAIAYPR